MGSTDHLGTSVGDIAVGEGGIWATVTELDTDTEDKVIKTTREVVESL